VRHLSIREELLQFVNLWSLIRNVKLNPHLKDEIRWKWTSNGEYTMASAYKIQFQGSHALFQVDRLWKASVEPKEGFLLDGNAPKNSNSRQFGIKRNAT
jgi:hypothetical protein